MKMKFAKGVILWPFVGVTLLLAGIVVADIDPDIKEILSDVVPKANATANATKAADNDPLHISAAKNKAAEVSSKTDDKESDDDGGPDLMDEEKELTEEEEKAANDTQAAETAAFLPEEGAAEKEHSNSLAIFFVLSVLILCVFLIHLILQLRCHYVPESLAIVFLGACIGLFMRLLPTEDVKSVESFSPTMFFLVLLPPIIFESGYNLHKGWIEIIPGR